MSNDKMREALENSANFYFSERSLVLDTIDRRSVYSAAFSAGANWQAAITQQTESEPPVSCNYGQNCEHCESEHGCRPKRPESEPSYFIVCGNIPGAMPVLFADQQSATHYAERCSYPQSAYIMPLYIHSQSSNQQPEKEPAWWGVSDWDSKKFAVRDKEQADQLAEYYQCGKATPLFYCVPQPSPQVPEGWKLIPIEPTTDALYALAEVDGYVRGDRDMPGLTRWEDYYRAIYAALSAQYVAEKREGEQ